MTDELREAVATVYREAAQRLESLLSTHESRGRDTAAEREQIARVVNRLVPEIRATLRRVEADQPV